MAVLILPNRWLRQPQTVGDLDYYWARKNPELVMNGRYPGWDAGRKRNTDLSNGFTPSYGVGGAGPSFPSAGNRVYAGRTSQIFSVSNSPSTVFAVFQPVTVASRSALICVNQAGTWGHYLEMENTTTVACYVNPGSGGGYESSATANATGLNTACSVFDGTNASLFTQGVLRSGPTGVTGPSYTPDSIMVGAFSLSATEQFNGVINLAAVFASALSSDEVVALSRNPWQLFRPNPNRLYFFGPAAGGNVNITPAQGSVVITGKAPVLATSLIPTAGSIAITGYAPSIVQTTAITPGVGSVTVSGAAGLLNLGVIPTAGSVAITGYAPTVNTSGSSQITPSVGSVTIAGYAPITNLGTVVPSGSIALSGYSPSVVQSILITPGSGSISITGYAPTLTATANVNITPDAGSVGITGYAPTITGIAIVSAAPSVGAGKATRDRSAKRQKFIARIDGEDFVVNSPAEAEALINQAREKAAELARVRASEIVAKRKAKANKGSLLNTKPLTIDIPQVDIRKGDRFSEAANLFRQQLQAEIDNAFSQAARDAEISLLMHLHKQLDDEAAIVALLF